MNKDQLEKSLFGVETAEENPSQIQMMIAFDILEGNYGKNQTDFLQAPFSSRRCFFGDLNIFDFDWIYDFDSNGNVYKHYKHYSNFNINS